MKNNILKKITQKSRIAQYKFVLEYALKNNYKIVSLIDWYLNYQDKSDEKILILRHDVDLDTDGAKSFFNLEKSLGVKSTYYFRWKTMNNNLMHKMHNDGFEVSLHFETLANYAKKHKIFSQKEITHDIINKCKQQLSNEIKQFEKQYFPIKTICSHGDKRNRIINTPNHIITDKSFLQEHNILFETYDKEIINKFDAYISDSSIYSNFEWKHYGSPFKAIDENIKTICLLTHPIHWNQYLAKNIRMLWSIYFDNL